MPVQNEPLSHSETADTFLVASGGVWSLERSCYPEPARGSRFTNYIHASHHSDTCVLQTQTCALRKWSPHFIVTVSTVTKTLKPVRQRIRDAFSEEWSAGAEEQAKGTGTSNVCQCPVAGRRGLSSEGQGRSWVAEAGGQGRRAPPPGQVRRAGHHRRLAATAPQVLGRYFTGAWSGTFVCFKPRDNISFAFESDYSGFVWRVNWEKYKLGLCHYRRQKSLQLRERHGYWE